MVDYFDRDQSSRKDWKCFFCFDPIREEWVGEIIDLSLVFATWG